MRCLHSNQLSTGLMAEKQGAELRPAGADNSAEKVSEDRERRV